MFNNFDFISISISTTNFIKNDDADDDECTNTHRKTISNRKKNNTAHKNRNNNKKNILHFFFCNYGYNFEGKVACNKTTKADIKIYFK
jgi:hypothetical protein